MNRSMFLGEALGTLILVFFGCGSVCASVRTGAQSGVFQVAIVWGIGIGLAIHLTGALSGAHLNPAVTVAMAIWDGLPGRRILPYVAAQFLGAFLATALLHFIYSDALAVFENTRHLVRGAPGSEASAMIFAEYFPNPGGKPLRESARQLISPLRAFGTEVAGTAILLLVICGLTDRRNPGAPDKETAIP